MKQLKELFEEIFNEINNELENKNSSRPTEKDVLSMLNEKSLKTFDKIGPVDLYNNCVDLNNHLILVKMIKNDYANLTKKELQKLNDNLLKIKRWLDDVYADTINLITTKINNTSYENMTKEELIEKLKKLKGE